MKNKISTLVATVFMAVAMTTGCQSSSDKVENAQENVQEAKDNVVEANKELDQAVKDSVELFKKESEVKITALDKNIADFKLKIAKEKKETKAGYDKKIAEIEQKNNDMKKKLADYKEEGNDKWHLFKKEFNHDMDEMGKAFKDLTVKNVK